MAKFSFGLWKDDADTGAESWKLTKALASRDFMEKLYQEFALAISSGTPAASVSFLTLKSAEVSHKLGICLLPLF